MTTLVIIFCSYLAIALLIAAMVRRAPVGYEDDTGFHQGERPSKRTTERAAAHSLAAKR